MNLRLVLSSYTQPTILAINGHTDLPKQLIIDEYVNPQLRAELGRLLDLEQQTLAARKELHHKLVSEFNSTISPLSEADVRAHLINKYPEYFI